MRDQPGPWVAPRWAAAEADLAEEAQAALAEAEAHTGRPGTPGWLAA